MPRVFRDWLTIDMSPTGGGWGSWGLPAGGAASLAVAPAAFTAGGRAVPSGRGVLPFSDLATQGNIWIGSLPNGARMMIGARMCAPLRVSSFSLPLPSLGFAPPLLRGKGSW